MTTAQRVGRAIKWTATGVGLATAGYRTLAGLSWLRYGHPARPRGREADPLLDRFMPQYEVAERHRVRIAAPADVAMQAAAEMDLEGSGLIRAIFRARELVVGTEREATSRGGQALTAGFTERMMSIGWGKLAEVPDREIVMGAVTRPWEANVVFRAIPPERFTAFAEPNYVKIVWTLRADPAGPDSCVFRTETRVMTTDAEARSRFRRYWAKFSPGIVVIRRVLLRRLRKDAERKARARAA